MSEGKMGNQALRDCVAAMQYKPNRVCKEHRDSFSRDCGVCKLERARNELVFTFWYVAMCCEGPYFDGEMMYPLSETPPPPPISTNEEGMKERLDHILVVADTMVDRYGNPNGKIKPWPRPGSKGVA
jgi:hypothetical protein